SQTWKGVLVYDETQQDKPRLILAKEGVVRKQNEKGELELELRNGSWHEVDPTAPKDYTYVYFFQNIFPISTPLRFTSGEIPKGDREQTIPELKRSISDNKKKHLPWAYLAVELQKKYAIPFACIVFSCLAVTLGVNSKKGGRSSAYAVSIG